MRHLLIGFTLTLGACSYGAPLPSAPDLPVAAAPASGCTSKSVTISFDFEGASASHCVIEGERAFSILITPEHAPPINPSPWYAFRYAAEAGPDVAITLRYLASRHRYQPKLELEHDGEWRPLEAEVREDGTAASFILPAGAGRVAGQEIFDTARHHTLIENLARSPNAQQIVLGTSHDRRPIEALRLGDPKAARLVVLLGRAHPPEVTGALAMEVFVEETARAIDAGELNGVQVLAVPLLNPDGVARGHWRANLGGLDLNRDWGNFSQPETRAVAAWLDQLPPVITVAAMVDFHSTQRNLFYVQGEAETDEKQERFLAAWLGGQEQQLPDYPFTIERRNANPGSGTSKNWFHARYAIPAYTYEVGDETDRDAIESSARILSRRFTRALKQ